MKIVADDKIPYIRGVFEPYADITYLPGKAITAKEVKEADALLVRTRTRCDAALLAGSSVRMVATATIGTDHIDLPWCAAHGIKVVSAPGCNAGGVLQWVAAALARTVGEASPTGLTLGIVGIGHVGSLVERYDSGYSARTRRAKRPRSWVPPMVTYRSTNWPRTPTSLRSMSRCTPKAPILRCIWPANVFSPPSSRERHSSTLPAAASWTKSN